MRSPWRRFLGWWVSGVKTTEKVAEAAKPKTPAEAIPSSGEGKNLPDEVERVSFPSS